MRGEARARVRALIRGFVSVMRAASVEVLRVCTGSRDGLERARLVPCRCFHRNADWNIVQMENMSRCGGECHYRYYSKVATV